MAVGSDSVAGALVPLHRGRAPGRFLAKAAALASKGFSVQAEQCPEVFEPFIEDDNDLRELIQQAATSALRGETARQFCRQLKLENGITGYMYHTLPVVLQIWLRFPLEYEKAMNEAIGCGGDTDTVAAILGGIIGAGTGAKGIPVKWRNDLWEWPRSIAWMTLLTWELTGVKLNQQKRPAPGVLLIGLLARNVFFMIWVLLHGFRRLLPPY